MERERKTLEVDDQIIINTMSRSGSHAVANWIGAQLSGNVEFRNNLANIYWNNQLPDPLDKRLPFNLCNLPSTKRKGGDIDHLLYTCENVHGNRFFIHPLVKSRTCRKIILLRDPYNLLASLAYLCANGFDTGPFWFAWEDDDKKVLTGLFYRFMDMWRSHAVLSKEKGIILIAYNKWKDSKAYRDSLASELGLPKRSDDSLNQVPDNGGGSSFDGLKFEGRGKDMNTNERWKHFENEDWFINFFKEYPRIVELSNEIFGEIC
jgi:hypothetical protein